MDRSGTRASLDAWFATVDELLEEGLEESEPLPEANCGRQDEDAA